MLDLIKPLVVLGLVGLATADYNLDRYGDGHRSWRYDSCKEGWGDCTLVTIPLSVSTPLGLKPTECGVVTLDWSDGAVKEDSGITWSLYANATYPTGHSGNLTESYLAGQDFLTPAQSLDFKVNYPEGTHITFLLDGYNGQTYYAGESKEIVVGAAKLETPTCIPDSHTPVVVTWPESVTSCDSATISWSGGATNTSLYTEVWVNGHGFVNQLATKESSKSSKTATWNEHYPVGARVTFAISAPDYGSARYASRSFDITTSYDLNGKEKKCKIPQDNRGGLWQGRKGLLVGIIVGSVIGGLALIAAIASGLYRFVYLPRKQRGVQLP